VATGAALTTRSTVWDVLIIGRGIAALQAHRILDQVAPEGSVAVVGPSAAGPHSATGLPEALVHPFPGRSFRVPAEQWEAIRALNEFLDWMELRFPEHLLRTPMVRPLLGGVMDRLERSHSAQQERLEEAGVQVTPSNLSAPFAVRRALSYPGAAILSLRDLLRDYFRATPHVFDGVVRWVDLSSDALTAHCADGQTLRAKRLIWAVGAAVDRPLCTSDQTVDAGTILYGQPGPDSPLNDPAMPRAWSAGVHMARGRGEHWGLGSTHFDSELAPMSPADAAAALLPKLGCVLPAHDFDPTHVFSGARLVPKDRRPLVGALSDRQWLLTGLGGTGLLWSAICAEWLIREMGGGPPIPRRVNLSRI